MFFPIERTGGQRLNQNPQNCDIRSKHKQLKYPISKHIDENPHHSTKVDIRPVKTYVSTNYSEDSAIYAVILTEQDFLEPSDFVAKLGVWDKLSGRMMR